MLRIQSSACSVHLLIIHDYRIAAAGDSKVGRTSRRGYVDRRKQDAVKSTGFRFKSSPTNLGVGTITGRIGSLPPLLPLFSSPPGAEKTFSSGWRPMGETSPPHKGGRTVSPPECRGGECLPHLRTWGRTWGEFSPYYLTSGGKFSPCWFPPVLQTAADFETFLNEKRCIRMSECP